MTEVYAITNRPDLVTETKTAVKAATLKAHQIDFFPKDIYETAIIWDPVSYVQSLDYRVLVPQWRAFKYLRKMEDDAETVGAFFTLLTPEQTLDSYGVAKEDVCYLAGEQIEIKSSTEDTYMLLGCYVHPVITDSGYSSWIATEHPYAIVYEAASKIFSMIGWQEQDAAYRRESAEQFRIIRNSQIQAQGY
jgi:hypothetical protein